MDACGSLNAIVLSFGSDLNSIVTQEMYDSWAEGTEKNWIAICPAMSNLRNCVNQTVSGCMALISELKIECNC